MSVLFCFVASLFSCALWGAYLHIYIYVFLEYAHTLDDGFNWILDEMKGCQKSNTEQLHKYQTDIAKVFLASVASVRLKVVGLRPDQGLLDRKWFDKVFCDEEFFEKRSLILLESLKQLDYSQGIPQNKYGPSVHRCLLGIDLLLDRKGTSTELLDALSVRGISSSYKYTTMLIRKLAGLVRQTSIRKAPPEGYASVKTGTADNANKQTFDNEIPSVAVATIETRHMPLEEHQNLKDNYIAGLPAITDELLEDVKPTEAMNEQARDFLRIQDCLAIKTVFFDYLEPHFNNGTATPTGPKYSKNDKILFIRRGRKREAKVVEVESDAVLTLTIEFEEEFEAKRIKIPSSEVERAVATSSTPTGASIPSSTETNSSNSNPSVSAANLPARESTSNSTSPSSSTLIDEAITNAARSKKERMDDFRQYADTEFVEGVDDGGGRKKGFAASTIIDDLLTDVSSKHDVGTDAVIDSMSRRFASDEEFRREVQPVCTDQEFLPRMYHRFFSSLKSDKPISFVPVVALGHAMKSVEITLQTHFQSLK